MIPKGQVRNGREARSKWKAWQQKQENLCSQLEPQVQSKEYKPQVAWSFSTQSPPLLIHFLQQGCTTPNSTNKWRPSIQIPKTFLGHSYQITILYFTTFPPLIKCNHSCSFHCPHCRHFSLSLTCFPGFCNDILFVI